MCLSALARSPTKASIGMRRRKQRYDKYWEGNSEHEASPRCTYTMTNHCLTRTGRPRGKCVREFVLDGPGRVLSASEAVDTDR